MKLVGIYAAINKLLAKSFETSSEAAHLVVNRKNYIKPGTEDESNNIPGATWYISDTD